MLRSMLILGISFLVSRRGFALRMSQNNSHLSNEKQTQVLPHCLQKEHIREEIDAFLKNHSKESKLNTRLSASSSCPPVRFLDPPRNRYDLGGTLKNLGLRGIGVEVGVKQGDYTGKLLKQWKTAGLYVQVDLWEHQDNYHDIANVDSRTHSRFQQESCSAGHLMKSKGYVGELMQCKDFSIECAKLFPDNSIDFLYIDARHDRKGVLEDLQTYWPKVKIGGVVAGHDYMEQYEVGKQRWDINGDGSRDETGRVLKGAVNDFFSGSLPGAPKDLQDCPRQPVITYREQAWNTWIVAK